MSQEDTNFKENKYFVKIKQILLYDPTFFPHHLKKPEEFQIQDEKLIYYFPENENIHIKRNHVGLAEGGYDFWKKLNQDYSEYVDHLDQENMKEIEPIKGKVLEQQSQYQFNLDKQEGIQNVKFQTKNSQKLEKQELNDENKSSQKNDNKDHILDENQQSLNKDINNQNNLLSFSPQNQNLQEENDENENKDSKDSLDSQDGKFEKKQTLQRLNKIDQFMNIEQIQKEIQQEEEEKIKKQEQSNILNSNQEKQKKSVDLLQDQLENNINNNNKQDNQKQPFHLEKDIKYQVQYFDRFIHVTRELEENIWIYMVLQKKSYQGLGQKDEDGIETGRDDEFLQPYQAFDLQDQAYYPVETNKFRITNYISKESVLNICTHFYQCFQTFFGNIRPFLKDQHSKDKFNNVFSEYIRRYQILNSYDHQYMNTLNYVYKGLQYAPIQQTVFLTIQYLLNMLKAIDNKLKHFCVFFQGYFVYSTFSQKTALFLYDYYNFSGLPFELDDEKIQSKFMLIDNIQDKDIYNYGYFCNSLSYGQKTENNNSKQQEQEKDQSDNQYVQLQKVYLNLDQVTIQNSKNGQKQQQFQMNSFSKNGLHILMFYDEDVQVQKQKIQEINSVILKNMDKISQRLLEKIQILQIQEQPYTFLYYNNINFASRLSNEYTFKQITGQQRDFIKNVYEELNNNEEMDQSITKITEAWIVGIKKLDRILIVLLPSNLTLTKVQEEILKLEKKTLKTIYL
ncbi:hypothetical protein PPERSA_02860 [Pseudocohnilembus persalinus]|uniref:CCZ1/INTU/HSP4 first Longin domain-containing protein n=1 Tax=Pseudocohnilembus persalinus TaxID=266149 RepID=A0A0V0QM88_PSEPJ|nr:hypothetical protein PPERSA_02860 [Pseudocohnilembus persalinus]|eukprot:KRX03481.1 hypothetical protein PPERSA_02860 [Pseudocohnilembus persalinus]